MVIRGKHSIEFIYCGCGCGKTRFRYDTHGREFFYINGHQHRGRILMKMRGDKHPMWKGGIKHIEGYVMLLKPDHPFATQQGYVKEHRLIYEQYYNCCLLPWIDIHHINNIKDDNRIENLKVMTRSEHGRHHNPIGFKVGTFKKKRSEV
jgi:HNH endonuclease